MAINWLAVFVAALIPMVIGFLWYSPWLFHKPWMKEAGLTEADVKGGNMPVIFGVSFVLALLLSLSMHTVTIHQASVPGLVMDGSNEPPAGSEEATWLQNTMEKYGNNNRTFKHGMVHALFFFLFFGLPILGSNALFERKGFKYILINGAYWLITTTIMGGIICGWP